MKFSQMNKDKQLLKPFKLTLIQTLRKMYKITNEEINEDNTIIFIVYNKIKLTFRLASKYSGSIIESTLYEMLFKLFPEYKERVSFIKEINRYI